MESEYYAHTFGKRTSRKFNSRNILLVKVVAYEGSTDWLNVGNIIVTSLLINISVMFLYLQPTRITGKALPTLFTAHTPRKTQESTKICVTRENKNKRDRYSRKTTQIKLHLIRNLTGLYNHR